MNDICDHNYDLNDESNYKDNDEDDGLLVQKLPVADFDDYDENLPPENGQDYLRRVQLEAKKCPNVVVADIDLNKFKPNQTYIVNNNNGFTPAKPEFSPSIEWQREQITDFTRTRIKLSNKLSNWKYHHDHKNSDQESSDQKISDCSTLPLTRYRTMSWWKEHCLGRKSDDNSSSLSSSSSSCSDSDTNTNINNESEQPTDNNSQTKSKKNHRPKGHLPLLSTLGQLEQDEIQRLIIYHIKWIKQFGFNNHVGLWLYSLFVMLEKPLTSEYYSVLRELSRLCSQIRDEITSNKPIKLKKLTSLNLIICIIARYFDQCDMIDE